MSEASLSPPSQRPPGCFKSLLQKVKKKIPGCGNPTLYHAEVYRFRRGGGGSEAYIVLYKDFQGGEGGGIIQNYIRVKNHFD